MTTKKHESFGGVTGRDFWIIPRALYIASNALRAAPYFADSDADDVETILRAKFPGTIERERMWDRVREAEEMGLGQPPMGTMTLESIEAWIKAQTRA